MKLYQDKLIVITGGAGFIGSALVRHLNDQGIENIIIVDHLGTSDKWKNMVGKKILDVLEKDQFFSWLEGKEGSIQSFLHLGACSSTIETNASYLLENNYRFSVQLAEYACRNGQQFIYASSASTYGDGSKGFLDDVNALEDLEPLNMYGLSKQLFDVWIKRHGLLGQVVGLKYFNVFGPNEYHKGRMASAILKMVCEIKKEGKIHLFRSDQPALFKDGEQKRDFIYVKDVARMTCAFLNSSARGIFNIGTGIASSWNALAQAVFKALGKEPRIEYVDMPEDLIGKYQNFTEASMDKTRKILGKEAQTMLLEDSVADYVQNYLEKGLRW